MSVRVLVNAGMREAVTKMRRSLLHCPCCGEDLKDHNWFDVRARGTGEAEVINCDRVSEAA